MPKTKAKESQEEKIEIYEYTEKDIASAIAKIGELTREKSDLENKADSIIARIQERLAAKIQPIEAEIKKISLSVKSFADKNREKILPKDSKSKTLKTETGEFSYKDGKPSVEEKSTVKLIDDILKKNNLLKVRDTFVKKMEKIFIRVKLELNKDSILDHPGDAKKKTGIKVAAAKERFYITPNATNTEMEVSA